MSLQIWLPFNGNLKNQGINATVNFTGTPTYGTGKWGQCRTNGTVSTTSTISTENGFAFSLWWKISQDNSYSISLPVDTGPAAGKTMTFSKMDYSSNTPAHYAIKLSANSNTPQMLWVRDTRSADGTWALGEWNHYVVNIINKDGKMTVNIWVNGEKKYTYTSSTYAINLCPGTISLTGTAAIQDFKLYDAPLSQTEIERDYCSLLVHYPLRDEYIENTKNLLLYPTPGAAYTASWDSTLHPNAIRVSNWSLGYNGGVSTPAKGYHACWELIDEIPTIVMRDYNSGHVSSHRWLGVSSNSTTSNNLVEQIGPGKQYTISFEARSDTMGKQMNSGLYFRLVGATSNSFHDGTVTFNLTPTWTRYSFTKTLSTSADTSVPGQIYIYGHTGTIEGTVYVRNVQLETKNHDTAYTETIREDEPIYDCSGYRNHSIDRGNLILSKDTIRNTNCVEFLRDNAIKFPSPYGNAITPLSEFSISMWVNLNNEAAGYRTVFVTNYGANTTNQCGWLSFNTEGKGVWFYSNSTYFGTGALLKANIWYHIVLTFKNGVAQWYVNGEKYGSTVTSSTTTFINAHPYFGLGDSYTGSSWSGAPFDGKLSDFRFYGVAIPESVAKDLYMNSATVDNQNNLHAFEYVEV